MMPDRRGSSGFTLPELLIAVAVFGLITTAAYSALDGLTRSAGELEQRRAALEELHWAVSLMDRDFRQGLRFESIFEEGITLNLLTLPAISVAETAVQPEAIIWQSSASDQGDSDLRRWPRNHPEYQRVFEGVQMTGLQWLDSEGQPLASYQAGQVSAVAYELQSDFFGTIERLVEVPGGG